MSEVYDQTFEAERSQRRWGNVIVVSLLVGLGWLLFELTAQPALGAVAVCAKFGWNDFRSACWLRRRDPNRQRAAACFWLFVASAFAKMAVSAFVLMFAYGLVNAMLEPPQPANPGANWDALVPVFIAMSLTLMVGFGLSALATVRALWLALRFHVKLWLNPAVHHARRSDLWPPACPTYHGNWARILIPIIFGVTYFLIAMVAVVLFVDHVQQWLGQQLAGLIVMAVVFLGPISILATRDVLAKRVLARYPAECWDSGDVGNEEQFNDY